MTMSDLAALHEVHPQGGQSSAAYPVYYPHHVIQDITGTQVNQSPPSASSGIAVVPPPVMPVLPVGAVSASTPGKSTQASGRVRKERKKYAPNACTNCRSLHLSCDIVRPCPRCVASGKADSCVTVYKKRGRPTKSSQSIAGTRASKNAANADAGRLGGNVDGGRMGSAGKQGGANERIFEQPLTGIATARSHSGRADGKRTAAPQLPAETPMGLVPPGIQIPYDTTQLGMPAQIICNPGGSYSAMSTMDLPALYPHVRPAYTGHVHPIYIPAGAGYPPPRTYPSPLLPTSISAVTPLATETSPPRSRSNKKARLTEKSSDISVGPVGGLAPASMVMSPMQHWIENGWPVTSPTFAYPGQVNQGTAAPYPYYTHPSPEYYAMNSVQLLQHSGQPQAPLPGTQYLQVIQTPSPAIPASQPALLPRASSNPQHASIANLMSFRPTSSTLTEANTLDPETSVPRKTSSASLSASATAEEQNAGPPKKDTASKTRPRDRFCGPFGSGSLQSLLEAIEVREHEKNSEQFLFTPADKQPVPASTRRKDREFTEE